MLVHVPPKMIVDRPSFRGMWGGRFEKKNNAKRPTGLVSVKIWLTKNR